MATLLATADASGWKDCGDDWTGCCKQDVKRHDCSCLYSSLKPLVQFTNVTELNSRGEADIVHLKDPFFTIEVQIRGSWSLSAVAWKIAEGVGAKGPVLPGGWERTRQGPFEGGAQELSG
eukprot:Skav203028  [mRNA]  locus=scaffold583:359611:362296:+ [translate_table: standard]